MPRDFTMSLYDRLCNSIKESGYKTYSVEEYVTKKPKNNFVILRHDVDKKPENSLKSAMIEYNLGLTSTYYFRTKKDVFKSDIIKKIAELGHEIGYHYEVLDKAKGDAKKAIEIFENELKLFSGYNLKTICMHGNPMTPWLNRDLWKVYDFKKYGITAEAYLSIDFSDKLYISDTGRTWSPKKKMKDKKDGLRIPDGINSTLKLIETIEQRKYNFYLLTHPNRWHDNISSWTNEYLSQNVKNVLKSGLAFKRKHVSG